MVANDFGYSIINARPHIDVALDGRPLVTRPIAGEPRPMIMGLARLESLRATRLVEAFEQHCRAAIGAGTVPGLGDARRLTRPRSWPAWSPTRRSRAAATAS